MIECIICKNEKELNRNIAISNGRHKICDDCLRERILKELEGE